MKATLKDGTVLEGTDAEVAEVLSRLAVAPPLQLMPVPVQIVPWPAPGPVPYGPVGPKWWESPYAVGTIRADAGAGWAFNARPLLPSNAAANPASVEWVPSTVCAGAAV